MSNFDGTTSKRRPCFQSRSKYATSKKKRGKIGNVLDCMYHIHAEWMEILVRNNTEKFIERKSSVLLRWLHFTNFYLVLFVCSNLAEKCGIGYASSVDRDFTPPPLPLFSCSRRLTPNFLYIFLAVYLHFYIHRDNSFRTRDTICILHQTVETLALARSRYCYENVGNSKNDVGAADTKKSHRRMYTKLE